jgi:hypothetical protein
MAQADECLAGLKSSPDNVLSDGATLDCCEPYCTYSGGVCTFQLATCPNQADETCTGADLKNVVAKTALFGAKKCGGVKGLKLVPGTGSTCGSFVSVTAKAKRRGQATGQCTLKLKTKSKDRPPRKDLDTYNLVCEPDDAARAVACGGDPTGCDGSFPTTCPPNAAGGPNMIRQVALATGTDLDNGFSGDSHNFPVIEGSKLELCLSNCNNTDDPICDTCARTGAGTFNGFTFGPPLPLVAGGVPVCVINRYKNPYVGKDGSANIATGELNGQIDLLSQVITTPPSRVCPRCTGGGNVIGGQGTCDGGLSNGQSCTIEGLVRVNSDNPPINNALYPLSSDCLPGGLGTENAGTLDIGLPLTTGTSTRTGRCPGQTQDDACGTNATCGSVCPGSPPLKGGVHQTCCSNETSRPCFPTRGGGAIMRTGASVVPQPPWDTDKETYPKTNSSEQVVAVFCIPATQSSTVNQVSGLPGPGALILPVNQTWSRTP